MTRHRLTRLLAGGSIAAVVFWASAVMVLANGEEDEGAGNNLSTPVIFAEGYGLGGSAIAGDVANTGLRVCTDDVAGDWGTPVTSIILPDETTYPLPGPYFLQGLAVTDPGGACWQADWVDNAGGAPASVDRADWGDNIVRVAKTTQQGPIRTEVTLYQDAPGLTGYVAEKLYPPTVEHESVAVLPQQQQGPSDGGQGSGGPGDGGQGPGGDGGDGGQGPGGPGGGTGTPGGGDGGAGRPPGVGSGQPYEVYGTAAVGSPPAGVRTTAAEATVYSHNARLSIHRLDWSIDPTQSPTGEIPDTLDSGYGAYIAQTITDGAVGSEVNQAGKVIYGYNWSDVPAPGWYRVTFSIDAQRDGVARNVEILGLDPGDLVADESEGGSDGGKATYHRPVLATAPDGSTYTYIDVYVSGVATAPVATDDTVTVAANASAVAIPVLANDSDPNGQQLIVVSVDTTGTTGTATVSADGHAVLYTPKAGFSGSDVFGYTIANAAGDRASATVTVTVSTVPPPPSGGGGGGAVPVPSQGFGSGEAAIVDAALNPLTDATTVDGKPTLVASSADGRVGVAIPVSALSGSGPIRVLVDVVDLEQALAEPLHHPLPGLVSVGGEALEIRILDESGGLLTQFAEDIAISVQLDAAGVNLAHVEVLYWDASAGRWLKVPTTVASDGTVTFYTDHLSLFAVFQLPPVAIQLHAGLNYLAFTGADGTPVEEFIGRFGQRVRSVHRYDVATQAWSAHTVGAPAGTQTLERLRERDVLAIRLAAGEALNVEIPGAVPEPLGIRTQALQPGLNALGVTVREAIGPRQLLLGLGDLVAPAMRFDPVTQRWQTWAWGAPAHVNTLASIRPHEVVWLRLAPGFGTVNVDFSEIGPHAGPGPRLLAAADDVVSAVRDRDRDRLRDLSCDGDATCTPIRDRDRVQDRDRDRDRLAACVPDGGRYYVIGRTIELAPDGLTAMLRVRLAIRDELGAGRVVEQQWEFQRSGQDAWRLANVPACPFQ